MRQDESTREAALWEITALVERAYSKIFEAHLLFGGAEEKGWLGPAIGKQFDELDEHLWELMDRLNEAARRVPYLK